MINSGILFQLNWSDCWPVLTCGKSLRPKIPKSKVYAVSRWRIELLESSLGSIGMFDFDEGKNPAHRP